MSAAFELTGVTKTFDSVNAIEELSLTVPRGSVVGLIGRNGCGKTTLLRHVMGLYLPTAGQCTTLGTPAAELGTYELSRIGVVQQESRFLTWMKVQQHLDYVASFYREWDKAREQRLLSELELDPGASVGTLSPGNQQKLALLFAVCHHPLLLLLDEPISAMDPIAREKLLEFLLDLLQEDENTTVISSHALRDIERVVERVVCLERGRLLEDTSLDALHERFSEWVVTSRNGGLPERFSEAYVIEQKGDRFHKQLLVANAGPEREVFEARHHVDVRAQPMNLERIFPLLLGDGVN